MLHRIITLVLGLVIAVGPAFGQRIQPEDLEYRGAFRLPHEPGGSNWEYSGFAMTHFPMGDPGGPVDGYPGSLFAMGHDHDYLVSEINIPIPIISPSKRLDDLNVAETLQPFADVLSHLFPVPEITRAGLAYLPAQPGQTSDKIHFCFGDHNQFDRAPSHGWCELTLSDPQSQGPWYFWNFSNYVTNDYLFSIPESWSSQYAAGQRLASGRFRDGGWSGLGPSLFIYGPWIDGNPPPPDATLTSVTPLLLYGDQLPGQAEIAISENKKMLYYKEPDEWTGGAWLSTGDASAVILVATKAIGNTWYGFSDGTVWPEEGPWPDVPPWPHDSRGWWSDDIRAQIYFYDTDDLGQVALNQSDPWTPQPYAVFDIDDVLFDPGFHYERSKRVSVGAACYDRALGFLYIMERRADEDRSLVHVWKVNTPTPVEGHKARPRTFELFQNTPNPFNPGTQIRYRLFDSGFVQCSIFDLQGRRVKHLLGKQQNAGLHSLTWDGRNSHGQKVESGIYLLRLSVNNGIRTIKLTLTR